MVLQCDMLGATQEREYGRTVCKFPKDKLSRIIGIASIGTALYNVDYYALSKVDKRKDPNRDLVFVPVDIATRRMWNSKYRDEIPLVGAQKEGTDKKEYMYFLDTMGRASQIDFAYREKEMRRVIRNNPRKEMEVFF